MWKYQCKTHLLSLLAAFAVGVILAVISLRQGLDLSTFSYPEEIIAYINEHPSVYYISGGLSIAGIVNVILLVHFASTQYNINPIFLIVGLMFFTQPILMLGSMLVIPAALVCIYGLLTSRSDLQKEYHNLKNLHKLL